MKLADITHTVTSGIKLVQLQRTLAVTLVMTLLCTPLLTQAQENRFQIDFMVFANNDPSAENSEKWPEQVYLRYPKNWANVRRGDQGKSFERIAAADPEFAEAAAAIKRSSHYRVLYQDSWQQDLSKLSNAPAVLIKGGRNFGEHSELEGYIKVAVERYLYVQTDLWLSQFKTNTDLMGRNRYYLPPQPQPHQNNANLVDEEYESSPEYQAFLQQNPELERRKWERAMERQQQRMAANGNYGIDRIVVMDQRRRMRSNELHFIDHPLFGAIVKITKMESLPEDALKQTGSPDPNNGALTSADTPRQ